MGIFTSLFGRKVQAQPPARKEIAVLLGVAKFEIEVQVGEQHQAALETICAPRKPRGVNRLETARLVLEQKNPLDKNAVRVEIRGRPVGYLCHEDAILCRQQLIARGQPHADAQCQATIRGGWISSDGRKGDYEVWLDLPTWQS